jgi:hypothetical protein
LKKQRHFNLQNQDKMKTIKNILLIIWQLPQTVVALVILCYYKVTGKIHGKSYFNSRNSNAVIYALKYEGVWGFSLGYFIFMTQKMSMKTLCLLHQLLQESSSFSNIRILKFRYSLGI